MRTFLNLSICLLLFILLIRPTVTAQWVKITPAGIGNPRAMTFHNGALIVGMDDHLYKSTDEGTTWSTVPSPVDSLNFPSVLASTGTTLFLEANQNLFRSTNNGVSWQRAYQGYVNCILVRGGIVYCGTGGVIKSTNNGMSWTDVNSGLLGTNFIALTSNAVGIFTTNDNGYYGAKGVSISTNNGTSWTYKNNGLTDKYVSALGVCREVLFAGTYYSGLFISPNSGTNWSSAASWSFGMAKVFSPVGRAMFAGAQTGVYLTVDSGATWTNESFGIISTNQYNNLPTISMMTLGDTTIFASDFANNYVWRRPLQEILVPESPTNLTGIFQLNDKILLNWNVNSTFETGFILQRKIGVGGNWDDLPPLAHNTKTFVDSNLADGTRYYYRVYAFTGAGASGVSNESNVLIPMNAPTNLVATGVSSSRIDIFWHDSSSTESSYRIERRIPPAVAWGLVATLGANAQAYSDTGLSSGTSYCYQVQAGNATTSSVYSTEGCATTASTNVISTISVGLNWNMVSVPVTVNDYSKTSLFPTAITNAYSYLGSYVISGSLQSGIGYWLKFSTPQSVSITGQARTIDTVDVIPGWNMIGSLSVTVPVGNVGSIPGGIRTTSFYGYAGSAYSISSTIDPGKGYWVKVSQSGKLILSSLSTSSLSDILHIELDDEAPPLAPGIESVTSVGIPNAFALEEVFPSPFNPRATIRYQVPEESRVSLTVYNLLGQVMKVLVDGIADAGFRQVEWDASSYSSGIYLCRFEASTFGSPSRTFVGVRKMALAK